MRHALIVAEQDRKSGTAPSYPRTFSEFSKIYMGMDEISVLKMTYPNLINPPEIIYVPGEGIFESKNISGDHIVISTSDYVVRWRNSNKIICK